MRFKSRLAIRLTAFGLIPIVALSSFALVPQKADASYNPENLISDSSFTDNTSMSADSIQSFLEGKNSGLKNYSETEDCGSSSGSHYSYYKQYYSCGQSVKASKIIYDAAQAYNISPRVILATIQKEQSLITAQNPLQSQINCAMGYRSCDSNYLGFFRQVDDGTWQFRVYIELMSSRNYWGYTPSSYPCSNATSLYSTGLYPSRVVTFYNPGGVSRSITIANTATAALYCYTPHVGPYSETGYSGSYNFVVSFESWFGSTQESAFSPAYTTHPDGTLIQTFGQPEVYLLMDSVRYHVPNLNTFNSRGYSWSEVRVATFPDKQTAISDNIVAYQGGTLIRGDVSPNVYVLSCMDTFCSKSHIVNLETFNGLGLSFNDVIVLPQSQVNNIGDSGRTINSSTPHMHDQLVLDNSTGKVYRIDNGTKRWIPTLQVFDANHFKWSRVVTASAGDLALPSGPDIPFPEGAVLRANGDPSVYVVNELGGVNARTSSFQKRHISSSNVLGGLSYHLSDVFVVDSSYLPSATGAEIAE